VHGGGDGGTRVANDGVVEIIDADFVDIDVGVRNGLAVADGAS
jgi:hypothetical protein